MPVRGYLFDNVRIAYPRTPGKYYNAMIDTGSKSTIINAVIAKRHKLQVLKSEQWIHAFGGSKVKGKVVLGEVELAGSGMAVQLPILSVPHSGNYLGMDYMKMIFSVLQFGYKYYRLSPMWPNPDDSTKEAIELSDEEFEHIDWQNPIK